jgi:hypothetical protein
MTIFVTKALEMMKNVVEGGGAKGGFGSSHR